MTDSINNEPLEYPFEYAKDGFPELDDRDYACILLPDLDYDAQLKAIHNLLQRHRKTESALSDEIRDIENHARQLTGFRNQQAVDEWIERLHDSVYQDAAHSMAAVGMLAPLVESIFYQALLKVRDHLLLTSLHMQSHPRWQHNDDKQWDCHFIWRGTKWTKDLVAGIYDLAEAVGLADYLPVDLRQKLQALFGYRNKMFHLGFEWPMNELQKFAKRTNDWPNDWFRAAKRDGTPWIFYMTEPFVSQCAVAIEQVIESIGIFARDLMDDSSAQHLA